MKRKKPYSSVDANPISVDVLARGRLGQRAVVGVDVARGELVMCLVWPDRMFERPWSVASPGQIHLAVSKLFELNSSCPVTVAMESSGTYGDCFRQALFDAGLAVQRVSAKAVRHSKRDDSNLMRNRISATVTPNGVCVHPPHLWQSFFVIGRRFAGVEDELT